MLFLGTLGLQRCGRGLAGAAAAAAMIPTRRVRRPYLIAALLGPLTFLVFLTDVRPMAGLDCIPARLLPFSILQEGALDLDEFTWLLNRGKPLFLERGKGGHWYSTYPVATPLLVTPLYVPVVWWLDANNISHEDPRFRLISQIMERVSAAFIAALSVSLVFLAAAVLVSSGLAVGLALAYGLGSSTWIISSQALWQHGPAELCLAGLSLCLLWPETRRTAFASGAFAAVGVLVRPTMLIFALLALFFVWRERRRHIVLFLIAPAIGAGLLLAYNAFAFGTAGGGYTSFVKNFAGTSLERVGGLLVSPNRGLFIYTPWALLALPLLALPEARQKRWLVHAFVGIVGYVVLFGSWRWWWAANTYGPRYLVDILPAIALCAAPAVDRLWTRTLGRIAVVTLFACGVAVQVIGVYGPNQDWNVSPNNVNHHPERLWDWRDAQIPRTLAGWPVASPYPHLIRQVLTDPVPALLRPFPPSELQGSIELHNPQPLRAVAAPFRTDLRLVNQSHVAWAAYSDYGRLQVVVAFSWLPEKGNPLSGDHRILRGILPLPHNIAPGGDAELTARLPVPPQPGRYILELRIAQDIAPGRIRNGTSARRVAVTVS